jgi:hypothetical protein
MPDGSINILPLVQINGSQDVTKARLNISLNRSYVNDSNLTFFNTTSIVTLRGITFSDPEPVIDYGDNNGTFVFCQPGVCREIGFLNNAFTFNVTQWSAFAARPTPIVSLVNLSPFANSQVLINETVNVSVNVTVGADPIDAVRFNITYPNGTVVVFPLLNESRDIFNFTWTDVAQRGRYNITFFANDTGNHINATSASFFVRRALNVIDAVEMVNDSFINYSVMVNSNVSNLLNLTVFLNRSTIKFINISDHREDSVDSVVRVGQAINDSPVFAESTNFSLDFVRMNFSSANVTATAKFDRAYKCAAFDRAFQGCDVLSQFEGENLWELIQNLTPGQNYTFLIRNATDPGFAEFNSSMRDGETNTTSTAPVTIVQSNFTPSVTRQFLLLGYGEILGQLNTLDVRAQFVHNDTLVVGNLSWQPDTGRLSNPPGDSQPFFTHRTTNLSLSPQNLTLQIFAEAGQTTFISRARAIAVGINTSDAETNESNESFVQLAPGNAFLALANASFTPRVNTTLLVIASAEMTPNATNESVRARLQHNGSGAAFIGLEGETAGDVELFATHLVVNATANVSQNFSIEASGEFAPNKAVRRARITIVPLNDVYHNASEARTAQTSITFSNKVNLTFALPAATDVLLIASANLTINQETNGRFVQAAVFLDNAQVGNITQGISDLTDALPFITVFQTNLSSGTHNARIDFRRVGGIGSTEVAIAAARITVIPIAAGVADIFVNASEIGFNVSHPREDENITINVTVRNAGTAPANDFIVQFFDNRTQINGNISIASIAAGGFVVVNVSYIAVIGNRTISVFADPLNNVTESNETNNNATTQLNVRSTTFFAGGLGGSNLTLESVLNQTKFNFGFNDAGNVYFFDIDASFNLTHLQALGRNRSGGIAFNDFGDADFILGSRFFNDSVRMFWTGGDNTTANTTRIMEIGNNTILNTPVINTTANGTFITGILWDTNDDDDGEFDTADSEDLVFVGNINASQDAGFGDGLKSDYAVRVPSLVRALKITRNQTAVIVELR